MLRAIFGWKPGDAAWPSLGDRLLRRVARLTARPSSTISGGRDIAVLDDLFPHPLSAFRFEEFVSYLDLLPKLRAYVDGRTLPLIGDTRSIAEVIADHVRTYPRHAGRISPLSNDDLPEGAVAYTIFADNIHFYLNQIEQKRMPFAFTLYAGGGFGLDRPDSDEHLTRVFGSPWFRRVIATETITRDYLLAKKLCPADRIVYILGGVIARYAFDPPVAKMRFGSAKKNIDICFVAGRYAPTGADKGYDLFVSVANRLCAAGVDARFHVVGNFDPTIIDLGSAASRFSFYGLRLQDFFIEFYRHMDLVLAPTRPFVRRAGAFDSFPTAACVEAGLQEVAVACTDQLGLNQILEDGREVVIIRAEAADITDRLMQLIADPERLAAIGENGRKRMAEIFNSEVQIKPRVEMLRSLANE
jgi:glycosyltransferase involved in cell wall biosynthesis